MTEKLVAFIKCFAELCRNVHNGTDYYIKVLIYTVGELKDFTHHRSCSKTTLITSSVSKARVNPPSCKMNTFFLGPWLLVCQFIDISNQMEPTGGASNVGQKDLYNALSYKKMFDPPPVVSF